MNKYKMQNIFLLRFHTDPFIKLLFPFIFFAVLPLSPLGGSYKIKQIWTRHKYFKLLENKCVLSTVMMIQEKGQESPSLPQRPLWWIQIFVVLFRTGIFFDARSDSLWLKAELATCCLFMMIARLHHVELSEIYKKLYMFNVHDLLSLEISVHLPSVTLLTLCYRDLRFQRQRFTGFSH